MSRESSRLVDRAIRELLAPVLRADGFAGTGRRLHRVRGELIHVFHVQGSMFGPKLAVNLGVHLEFLPIARGAACDPRKLGESECFLRRRMSEPEGSDRWWEHEHDAPSIEAAVRGILQVYVEHGRASFEHFGRYPDCFSLDSIGDPEALRLHGFHMSQSLVSLARIRIHQRDREAALEYLERALAPDRAGYHWQRRDLERLRDELRAN